MYKNLFGETIYEPDDWAIPALESGILERRYRLLVNQESKMGFALHSNVYPDVSFGFSNGVYCIWHKGDPFYVGGSRVSVRQRISRFVKEVRGLSTEDEGHPAAEKFREKYGESGLDDVSVSAVQFIDLQGGITVYDVESRIRSFIKPIGNVRI